MNGSARYADGTPHRDAAAYAALRDRLVRFAGVLAPMLVAPPPRLGNGGWNEASALGRLALRLRRLGKPDMREFLRLLLGNAHDAILDELADGPLAGALALDATLGGRNGPRAPGTVLNLMYRLAHGGRVALPRGGMGAVAAALARAATAAGAVLRTGAPVERILVGDDRAAGVVLAGGETIAAPLVLCSADARVLLRLTGPEPFDAEWSAASATSAVTGRRPSSTWRCPPPPASAAWTTAPIEAGSCSHLPSALSMPLRTRSSTASCPRRRRSS